MKVHSWPGHETPGLIKVAEITLAWQIIKINVRGD